MSEALLRTFFDLATFKRGQLIRSRVKKVQFKVARDGTESVLGVVRGSNDEKYDVEVGISRNIDGDLQELEGVCDCPMSWDCKHVVALLLEAMARNVWKPEPQERPDPFEYLKVLNSTQSVEIIAPKAELDKTLNTWLSNAPKKNAPPDIAAKQTLLFSLALKNGSVVYEVWNARLGTKGWTEIKPYKLPYSLEQLPGYAKRDRALLQAFQASHNNRYGGSSEFMLEDTDLIAYLLERLLATERCYWGSPQQKILLQKGEARAGLPAWAIEADGSQRPIFNTTPLSHAVLPFTPLCYVDTERGELGQLKSQLEPAAAKHFASCPPILPEMLFAFRDALRQRFPTIPEPDSMNTRDIVLPSRTIMTLKSQKATQSWQADLHYATLEFEYGDLRIPEGDKRELVSFQDGILERIKRNPDMERNAVMSLQALSFNKAVANTIPKVQHAWTFGAGVNTNDAWLDFLNRFVPTLQELGWTILEDTSWAFKIAQISDWYGSIEDKNDWFGLELGVIVDNKEISLLPILSGMIERLPKDFTLEKLKALPDKHIFYATLPDKRMLALPASRVRVVLGVLLNFTPSDPKAHCG